MESYGWVHDNPAYAIRETLNLKYDDKLHNILNIGCTHEETLENFYNIKNVGQLEDHIRIYGFPDFLHPATKFVMSIRLGLEITRASIGRR